MIKVLNKLKGEKLYFYITLLIACTLFIPKYSINSFAIILLVLVWIVKRDYRYIGNIYKNKQYLVVILFYFSFIIGIFYSKDINEALKILKLRLPILILPLIYCSINSFSKEQINFFKRSFVVATLVACLYCQSNIILVWLDSGEPLRNVISSYKYTYTYLTDFIDLHPTYFSYLIIIALIFLESILRNTLDRFKRVLWVILGLYFLFFLILIASRIAIIGLLIIGILKVVKILKTRSLKKIIIMLIALLTIIPLMSKFDFAVKRYKQVVNVFVPQKGVVHSSGGFRIYSIRIFQEEFKKAPVFGVGFGDGQKNLDNHYAKIGFPHMQGLDYHNQYIQTAIELGLVGLLLMVLNFTIHFLFSLKRNEKEYLYFLIITMLFLLVENMFIRHKGIVSYSLFNALLLFNFYKESKRLNK
ncbi:O-antigen ligase-like membrane protein [Lacinutrix venerupis]|uniref:O-antigen ligase family protein n=1 Tax=Lacinutrix venerupis TaxID=1486034 RepID=UPI000EAEE4AC|nr:O-antigen ligase family protein [Lacinutrix venerupis]RLJ63288.1 O-antigen ligase-like membrane protein [Lacinutrix venerupis]